MTQLLVLAVTLDGGLLAVLLSAAGALGALVAWSLRAGVAVGALRTRVESLERDVLEHQSEYHRLRAAHQALAERVARSSGRAEGVADATDRHRALRESDR